MKKTVIALVGALMIGGLAVAGPRDAGPDIDRMIERLNIEESKQAEVKKLFEEQFKARQEAREARRAEMEKEREAFHEKLSKVLTPEQLQQLEDRREAHMDRKGGGEGRHGDCIGKKDRYSDDDKS